MELPNLRILADRLLKRGFFFCVRPSWCKMVLLLLKLQGRATVPPVGVRVAEGGVSCITRTHGGLFAYEYSTFELCLDDMLPC